MNVWQHQNGVPAGIVFDVINLIINDFLCFDIVVPLDVPPRNFYRYIGDECNLSTATILHSNLDLA